MILVKKMLPSVNTHPFIPKLTLLKCGSVVSVYAPTKLCDHHSYVIPECTHSAGPRVSQALATAHL